MFTLKNRRLVESSKTTTHREGRILNKTKMAVAKKKEEELVRTDFLENRIVTVKYI